MSIGHSLYNRCGCNAPPDNYFILASTAATLSLVASIGLFSATILANISRLGLAVTRCGFPATCYAELTPQGITTCLIELTFASSVCGIHVFLRSSPSANYPWRAEVFSYSLLVILWAAMAAVFSEAGGQAQKESTEHYLGDIVDKSNNESERFGDSISRCDSSCQNIDGFRNDSSCSSSVSSRSRSKHKNGNPSNQS